MLRCVFLFALMLTWAEARAQLNGTYFIGGFNPDYATLSAAVADLNTLGISGPVTFLIRGGTYDEQVTITDFTRTGNPDDRVIFKEQALQNVTWTYSGATGFTNWVVKIFEADYITFEDITFTATAPAPYGSIFFLDATTGNTTYITLSGCTLIGLPGVDNSQAALIRDEFTVPARSNEGLLFENNTFQYGYTGIYDITVCSDCIVRNNTFSAQYLSGIFIIDGGGVEISGNTFSDWVQSSALYRAVDRRAGGSTVTGNTVTVKYGAEGIHVGGTGLIANNQVLMQGSNVEVGIYLNGNFYSILHNTVYVDGPSTADALQLAKLNGNPEDIVLKNNLLLNFGGGAAMRIFVQSLVQVFDNEEADFNNYYTTGSELIRLNSTFYPNIMRWRQASNAYQHDRYSVSKPVLFTSLSSAAGLHLAGSSLTDVALAGTPIATVTDDIDGDARDATYPFMGADEVSNPFGNLSGTYTAGPPSSAAGKRGGMTFDGFSEAVRAINIFPITGDITFKIEAGVYDGQVYFPSSYGGPHDITFEPASPSANVTIQSTEALGGSFFPGLVTIQKAFDSLTFRALRFSAIAPGTYNRIFDIRASVNLTMEDCTFIGSSTGTDDNHSMLYFFTGVSDLSLINNTFTSGYRAVDSGGNLSTENNLFTGNTFTSQKENAIALDGGGILSIKDNTFTDAATSNTTYSAVYINAGTNIQILGNTIRMNKGRRGIELGPTPATSRHLIANNMISLYGSTGEAGIYIDGGEVDVFHNTIFSDVGSGSGGAFWSVATAVGIELKNNIFFAKDTRPAMRIDKVFNLQASDYNNLFSSGPTLVDWVGTSYTTLAAYQAGTGFDPNSVTQNVTFVSPSVPYNLHLTGSSIGDATLAGTPLATVPEDFDGETRSSFAPYMGADEAAQLFNIDLDLTLILSGALTGTALPMRTDLNSSGILEANALMNPYAGAPYSCGGSVSVPAGFFTANPDIVDWVCLQLRTGNPASPPMNVVAEAPAFIKSNGKIVSYQNPTAKPEFDASMDLYWVTVLHRNHLSVMSAFTVDATSGTGSYDFGSFDAYGTNPQRPVPFGLFSMWGGDGDGNGQVTAFDFLNTWLPINGGLPGYNGGDFNMDGSGTAFDFLTTWLPANGLASQVP